MLTARRVLIATGVTAVVVAGAACGGTGKISEPWNDAPRSGNVNETQADVISFPDGFSNAATKCDHGNRVYVAFHADAPYAAIAVVAGDPSCQTQP